MHVNMLQLQQQLVCKQSPPLHDMRQRLHSAARSRPPGLLDTLCPCCTPPARRCNAARRRSAILAAATAVSPAEAVPAVKRARRTAAFPFVRLAGQEEMKLALLLNVIDPSIGGVLIMGDRGTGKSVAVRSVASPTVISSHGLFLHGPEYDMSVHGQQPSVHPGKLHCKLSERPLQGSPSAHWCPVPLPVNIGCLPRVQWVHDAHATAHHDPCAATRQVRAMVEMLPSIDVVPDDAFNSSPTDPKLMGPDALRRFRDGQQLPSASAPTPLVGLALFAQITSNPRSSCQGSEPASAGGWLQVELPLGATEDRICGTIDIEKALGEGIKAYEPGLLVRAMAAADGGVLGCRPRTISTEIFA